MVPVNRPGSLSVRMHAVVGNTRLSIASTEHQGLSKMKRNHIHLAQGLPGTGILSGMRQSSSVFIYIDLEKALQAGLKFSLSANGVVLSEGDSRGFIKPCFFQRVEDSKGNALTGWESAAIAEIATVDASPLADNKIAEVTEKVASLSTQT